MPLPHYPFLVRLETCSMRSNKAVLVNLPPCTHAGMCARGTPLPVITSLALKASSIIFV